jgi:tripartite-type tricarboxylate transporter receptor subunit TctC
MTLPLALGSALASLTLLVTTPTVALDAYPTQPIRMIIPFAPGGGTDQLARAISPVLTAELGQPIVLDFKTGAGGSLGAAELARAKPDGYSLMLALDSQAVNHYLIKGLPYDTFKSFDYLSLLITVPQVLVVRNTLPVNTVPELAAYIKAHPGTSYGSAGNGSSSHINGAMFAASYKVEATHVPYKGAGQLATDVIAGHVDFAFSGLNVMLPFIKSGKVRALAVSAAKRSPDLPDVPTVAEFLPGFEIPTWIGLVAPAGLPPEVRERILGAFRKAMVDPDVRSRLAAISYTIVESTPEEFLARVRKDSTVTGDLIRRKVLQVDQ